MMAANRIRPRLYGVPLPPQRWELWSRDLESARTCWGVRPHTQHVAEFEWRSHWRGGLDPASAVIHELRFSE